VKPWGEQLLGIACDAVFAVAEVVPQAALFLSERFGHDMPELEAFRRSREGTPAVPQRCSCSAGPDLIRSACVPLWLASSSAAAEVAAVLGHYGAHAAAMLLSTSFMPGQLDYIHKVRASSILCCERTCALKKMGPPWHDAVSGGHREFVAVDPVAGHGTGTSRHCYTSKLLCLCSHAIGVSFVFVVFARFCALWRRSPSRYPTHDSAMLSCEY